MKVKVVPTNEVTIEVTPRHKGNFGFISIGGEYRTAEEERRLAQNIESEINRHVDDIQYTEIIQKHTYQDEEGNDFESMYDLLDHHYNEEYDSRLEYRYDNSDGTGSIGTVDTFKEIIELAFMNPNGFKIKRGRLFDEQRVFLNNVIEAGLAAKNKLKTVR